MTKNGFIFLVMGFTGKKAAQFKEAYIAEFDRIKTELNNKLQDNLTYAEVIYVDKGKVVRTQHIIYGDFSLNFVKKTGVKIYRKINYPAPENYAARLNTESEVAKLAINPILRTY